MKINDEFAFLSPNNVTKELPVSYFFFLILKHITWPQIFILYISQKIYSDHTRYQKTILFLSHYFYSILLYIVSFYTTIEMNSEICCKWVYYHQPLLFYLPVNFNIIVFKKKNTYQIIYFFFLNFFVKFILYFFFGFHGDQ